MSSKDDMQERDGGVGIEWGLKRMGDWWVNRVQCEGFSGLGSLVCERGTGGDL